MLPCVEDGVDDAEVPILDWHGPASKGHHATTMGQVEIMQHCRGGSLQGTRKGIHTALYVSRFYCLLRETSGWELILLLRS